MNYIISYHTNVKRICLLSIDTRGESDVNSPTNPPPKFQFLALVLYLIFIAILNTYTSSLHQHRIIESNKQMGHICLSNK